MSHRESRDGDVTQPRCYIHRRYTERMRIAPVVCVPLLFATLALSDDVYKTYSKDKLVGSETASRPEPNAVLKSRTELSVEGIHVTFVQEGKLDATGRRLVSYACDIQAP